MKSYRYLLAGAALLWCVSGLQAKPVRILATGDMHGWIESQQVDGQVLGGSSEMLSYWKKTEGYTPDKFIVLSGGDVATGPALSTLFDGDPSIYAMNLMGYDASAIGNHEFDLTVDNLKKWNRIAKFPFLSANIVNADGTPAEFAKPYTIINSEGTKVGIIGLTTTELKTATNNAKDFTVLPYAEALKKTVPEVRKAGAETIVVVSHIPQDELIKLADDTKDLNIPLMIGGHSHELDQRKVGNTWVVNSGEWWRSYTRVDMDYNPKTSKCLVLSSKQVWLQQEKAEQDASVKSEVTKWKERMARDYGRELGFTEKGITRDSLYPLVVRFWLDVYPDADVAMNNFGSMRQDIAAGPINKGIIVGVMPFQNSLLQIKLPGEQLINYLPGYSFAGLRKDGESYILNKTGKQIDPKGVYKVLVTNYMYDVSEMLKKADPKPETVYKDWREPALAWLEKHPTNKSNPIEKLFEK